jgi:hypothetical protein
MCSVLPTFRAGLIPLLAAITTASLEGQQAPSNLVAMAASPTTVNLKWTGAAGANGYVVLRGLGSKSFRRLTEKKLSASSTEYTDDKAPPGTALSYRVRAVFGERQSSASLIVHVKTPAEPANTASAPLTTSSAPASSAPAPSDPAPAASEPQPAMQPPGQPTVSRSPPVLATVVPQGTRSTATYQAAPSGNRSGELTAVTGDPTNFVATRQGNRVLLTWNAVPGVSWYVLGGPGMGLYGRSVQGTTYTVGPLEPGSYEWTVASLAGEGEPPLTNGSYWPKARAVIGSSTAGSYRISVAGFRVNHNTHDDQLNRDGWGDEIFSSVVLQRFDRATGRLIESQSVTSSIHGDGNQAPDRVPQGRASGNGGLTAGDVVPSGWDERSPQPSPGPGRFPFTVWDGPLADGGDVLVLRPTLWEADGDRGAFDWWLGFMAGAPATDATWKLPRLQQSLGSSGLEIIPGVGRDLHPDYSNLHYASSDVIDHAFVGNTQIHYVNPGRHRPIGMKDHYWKDLLVVLTREKIEAELQRASQVATPAGLIAIPLNDAQGGTAPLNGQYVLYLRVERK